MNKTSVSRAKVLIVDDQIQMRAFLRSALKGLPVDTVEASDGVEAMTLTETERPDLVLSDYLMPNWDGVTLCRQLRSQSDTKPIKIVLITGEASQPMLLEAVNHGVVDAALVKPVDVHELQRLVKKLLALK